ncbi:hypothetical protein CMI37_24280 [Candidatus Pacearchaeota archaeon]|jgi:hypothetical protein|nr:hypothetical protein [Candidatus Pacearchaeota archaeon]|tara:strand:+ start:759 stop:1076 length:318 start_codon:yes stop_codon:yes gene_type:complete
MHAALRKEFENLKSLSKEKGVSISLMETMVEHVIFVSSGKKLVCLAIQEGKIHNMLNCFRVNLKKWEWAEAEGFNLEEGIPDSLSEEILIKLNTPDEYLSYLGLL